MDTPDVPAEYTAPAAENPHAGQGSAVILDIGGDIGALVVTCPDELAGREIEIVPAGSREPGGKYASAPTDDHPHDHGHPHDHDHDEHEHHGEAHASHTHPPGTPPHVGVVPRPMGPRMVATAVFGDLTGGSYELGLRPYRGEPDMVVEVVGGEAVTVAWPGTE